MSASVGLEDAKLRELATTVLRKENGPGSVDVDVDFGLDAETRGRHGPFLRELKNHVNIFPDDTHFYVFAQPGKGFGFAVCREEGCGDERIPLTKDTHKESADGGRAVGLGSLMMYRRHINGHATHKAMRNERVMREMRNADEAPVKRRKLQNFSWPSSSSAPVSIRGLPIRFKIRIPSKDKFGVATSGPPSSPASDSASSAGTRDLQLVEPAPMDVDLEQDEQAQPSEPEPLSSMAASAQTALIPTNDLLQGTSQVSLEALKWKLAALEMKRDFFMPFPDEWERVGFGNLLEAIGSVKTRIASLRAAKAASRDAEATRAKTEGETSMALVKTEESPNDRAMVLYEPRPSPVDDAEEPQEDDQASTEYYTPEPLSAFSFDSDESMSEEDRAESEPVKEEEPVGPLADVLHEPQEQPKAEDDIEEGIMRDAFPHEFVSRPKPNKAEDEDDLEEKLRAEREAEIPPESTDGLLSFFDKSLKGISVEDEMEARKFLGLEGGNNKLDGMVWELFPYQIVGVAWMVKHELENGGGILADEMGLGKTVQTIGLLSKNRSQNRARKTTLIIAPKSLMHQWENEINKATGHRLRIRRHHGLEKAREPKRLLRYDVVITTPQTMAAEWVDPDEDKKKKRRLPRKLGVLFQTEFYRIVIDEAQQIRSRTGKQSRAADALKSENRWCLTGTPITNNLEDAFSLLRFIKHRPFYEWKEFRHAVLFNVKRDPQRCSNKLQTIFDTCLLRRRKDTPFNGGKIVELPPKEVSLIELDFTTAERDIYNMMEQETQRVFNQYLDAGTVLKNFKHIFVMMLRLRQICSHSSLIVNNDGDEYQCQSGDGEGRDAATNAAMVLAKAATLEGAHFVSDLQLTARNNHNAANDFCVECREPIIDALVTHCKHVFCETCIANNFADDKEEATCPVCEGDIIRTRIYPCSAFKPSALSFFDEEATGDDVNMEDSDEEDDRGLEQDEDLDDFIVQDGETEEEKDRRREERQRQHAQAGQSRDINDFSGNHRHANGNPAPKRQRRKKGVPATIKTLPRMIPSAKMKHMMNCIQEVARLHPDEKTIILSQWTQCLDIVASYCKSKAIRFVQFDGSMDSEERDKAVTDFMKKDGPMIMLMSLKAGGVGLNLTRANRVINLDLAWNEAVEDQAFDRVHRMGQTRPVSVKRLVIKNTIEDRIIELQKKKKALSNGALGEGGAEKLGRLSEAELAHLFGLDMRGNRI